LNGLILNSCIGGYWFIPAQKPNPEPPIITLERMYPPNININPVQHPAMHYPSMETYFDAVMDEPQMSEQISILIGIPQTLLFFIYGSRKV